MSGSRPRRFWDQSSRLAEFGGSGMSFNIGRGTLGNWQCSRQIEMADLLAVGVLHCAGFLTFLDRQRRGSGGLGHTGALIQPRAYSALVFDECLLLRASERALFARPNRRTPCSGWRLERTAFAHWLAMTDRLRPVHTPQHVFAIPAFAQNRLTPTSDAPTSDGSKPLGGTWRLQGLWGRGLYSDDGLSLSCRSCRPSAPFAELFCLSKSSVAEEYYAEHSGNRCVSE